MQRIDCKKCGLAQTRTNYWFDPPDYINEYSIWKQKYICPKCKTVHTIECEYSIDFNVLDVQVDEVGDE